MSKIILGVTSDGKPFAIDLVLLLETRLLLQANSGGGKSWGIRRLIEQIFGKVQIILIDREGEFKSLRDKYDFLLVGEGGDIPAHIGSARLLAEKLLESGVSAICDLYEAFRTSPIRRMEWVREFLMGLVDAPKHLWHDVVVIVDEAHLLCPQVEPKGRNMEEREIISGCKEAMIALATVGRKRGQAAVWATQRLAKLDKDATAELLNRMVGMTMEDQDVDRAVDLMSVSREDRASFRKSLRELEPGNFYVFGRAISKERILVKVGEVETKHHDPRSRKHVDYSPPTPAKIKALLSKFEGLPKEIEIKAKTEAELRKENTQLRGQVEQLKRINGNPGVHSPTSWKGPQGPATKAIKTKVKEVPVLQKSELKAMGKILSRMDRLMKGIAPMADLERDLEGWLSQTGVRLQEATAAAEKVRKPEPVIVRAGAPPARIISARPIAPYDKKALGPPIAIKAIKKDYVAVGLEDPDALNSLQLRQLMGLAEFERVGMPKVPRRLLAAWLGLSYSGHFQNMFSNLHKRGLVEYQGDLLLLTDKGRGCGPGWVNEPTTPMVLENCAKALDSLRERQLRHLHSKYPEWIPREELAEALNLSYSGHFQNCFSTLHSARLIEYGEKRSENQGKLKCADWLFLEHMQYHYQPA